MKKYIPLVQKPECCAVTCFAMILYRKTWKLYDLQDLAKFFWVKISKDSKKAFNVNLKVFTSRNNDEWISTLESLVLINKFFKLEKLNYKAKAYKCSDINNFKEFIYNNLNEWNDLWVEYHNDEIHLYDEQKTIHDSLIESIDLKKDEVILVDPEYMHKPRIVVKLEILQRAISNTFWKETWIIVIEE